ncbi:hypothetical protein B296_00007750 [Ensete ventricosum]|uniref:Uncharacterized protein n=1 Tax=Ensete ventricosum TaxID=4639 RepID=A0A427AKW5_ENSVE|nr:hypothetical protein B296_00007750 [Ensete ventricosum]
MSDHDAIGGTSFQLWAHLTKETSDDKYADEHVFLSILGGVSQPHQVGMTNTNNLSGDAQIDKQIQTKFARRFVEGIGKFAGNVKGDREKEDKRICHKIAGGYRSMRERCGSRRKFARRFAEGIGKLAGNTKGDRRKEDRKTCRKIVGGCRSMRDRRSSGRERLWRRGRGCRRNSREGEKDRSLKEEEEKPIENHDLLLRQKKQRVLCFYRTTEEGKKRMVH